MNINWESVLTSLEIMGFGMLGIFIVMTLIYIVILILGRAAKPKPESGEEDKK